MDVHRHVVFCLLIFGASLPVIALFICVSLCISVGACLGTDCTDVNVLPSLSAAVSDEQPQRSVWTDMYANYLGHLSAYLSKFTVAILEVISLNLMGLFPSARLYESHRNCLAIFVFCSVIFMLCDTWLFSRLNAHTSSRNWQSRARKKRCLCFVYITTLIVISVCYFVHTTYCPPYVYSLFSFFEYLGIIINVCYQYYVFDLITCVPLYRAFGTCDNSEQDRSVLFETIF
ncbi:hypothetical protein P879_01586 [Paragonimus westermani]|uniref:CWH43-like N-terminal domain-containing protein n=1 Tax=Paragonimus westermani TaxID=34504 RepID=A0A8T0DSY8_9TREM|nr:hypothetical protein P879_01586 [Paragonimus westermani]